MKFYGNYGGYSGGSYCGTAASNCNETDKALLKKFYRTLSKAFHPDSNPDKDTSEEILLPSAAFFPVEITTILLHLCCKRRMSINYHKNENPLNSMRQTNKNTVKFPVCVTTFLLP